VHQVGDQPTLS